MEYRSVLAAVVVATAAAAILCDSFKEDAAEDDENRRIIDNVIVYASLFIVIYLSFLICMMFGVRLLLQLPNFIELSLEAEPAAALLLWIFSFFILEKKKLCVTH